MSVLRNDTQVRGSNVAIRHNRTSPRVTLSAQIVSAQRLGFDGAHGILAALVRVALDRSGGIHHQGAGYYMKQETQVSDDEPVGIVISRGWEPATTPRFSAYMWSHGPEDETEQEAKAA